MALSLSPGRVCCQLAFLVLLGAAASSAQAQGWARALGGAGAAAADASSKRIDAELQIETAKKLAEMEAADRRAQRAEAEARRQSASAPASSSVEEEEAKLGVLFPSWAEVIASPMFNGWLNSRQTNYANVCRNTVKASVMYRCINDFLAGSFASK